MIVAYLSTTGKRAEARRKAAKEIEVNTNMREITAHGASHPTAGRGMSPCKLLAISRERLLEVTVLLSDIADAPGADDTVAAGSTELGAAVLTKILQAGFLCLSHWPLPKGAPREAASSVGRFLYS